jgi:hypothetical protein
MEAIWIHTESPISCLFSFQLVLSTLCLFGAKQKQQCHLFPYDIFVGAECGFIRSSLRVQAPLLNSKLPAAKLAYWDTHLESEEAAPSE